MKDKALIEKNYPMPSKQYSIQGDKATWDADAEDYNFWGHEGDKWAEDYATAYKGKIDPKDFLGLTLEESSFNKLMSDGIDEFKPLDIDKFNKERHQPIFLWIDIVGTVQLRGGLMATANVIGHEGRHRCFGLMNLGVKSVDIEIRVREGDYFDKHNPSAFSKIILLGQFNKHYTATINNPTPMSWRQHKAIRPELKDECLHESKDFRLSDYQRRLVREFPFDKYHVETVNVDDIVKSNKLLDDKSILDRRASTWGKTFSDFHFSKEKANYDTPIRLSADHKVLDGHHRLIALYNDGFNSAEVFVKNESLNDFCYSDKEDALNEKIVKKGSKWQVQSEKGRNMGTYDTKAEAEKRLQQVHYFKHMNEDYFEGDFEDVYDELLNYESDKPALGPGFITEEGTFINLDGMHGDIFGSIDDYESEDFYTLEDKFNLIKMNGGCKYEPYPYIDLWGRPNKAQESAIIKWIDFLVANGKKTLLVNNGNFDETYNIVEMIPEDILKDCYRRMNESLNESKDELLDTLYSTKEPEYGSCYLLDDGTFVFPFTKDEKTSLAFHGDEEDIIYAKYGQFKGYDLNHELQHDYNVITLNSRKPECRMNFSGKPTNAQYSALLKWLDFVMAEGNDKVDFEDYGTEQTLGKYATINLNDKTPEEIIDSIKRYFVSGVLVESKQDIEKFRQWAGDELANRFFKLKDRLPDRTKDIYFWMSMEKQYLNLEDRYKRAQEQSNISNYKDWAHEQAINGLKLALDEIEKTPTRKEINKLGKEGAEKIYEDDNWLVLKINTYEASVKYGKDTRWCITGNNSDQGRDDFDFHTKDNGATMYFFLNKKNKYSKYALEYMDDENWCLFDETDFPHVGYGTPFNNGMDVTGGECWHKGDLRDTFPIIKGLPDINKAYDDFEKYDEESLNEDLQETDNEGNVLSKEQIEFFKNSKVRDEQGRLIVCYHGSGASFNTFEKGDIGFHFGTLAQAKSRNNKVIYQVYLNITNYMYFGSDLDSWDYKHMKDVLIGDILEDDDAPHVWVIGHQFSRESLAKYRITERDVETIKSINNDKEMKDFLLSKGIDGIMYYNDGEDRSEGSYSYIAFEPNQIKSIDNKNPTSSNNINEDYFEDDKLVVYRVGQVDDFKQGLFFADSLDYFDYSDTGYEKEDAEMYELDLKNAKVFDPMKEWNLSVNTWSDIRQSEEFFKEHDYPYYEYLDEVDYDDINEYHEVMTDTDYLAQYAYEEGYDVCILRDIPGDGGRGPNQTEYCVFNKNLIKKVEDESLKEEAEDRDIYYRGYDSRYGVFDSNTSNLYTWVTDSIEYASEYAEHNEYGKIAKVRITCSDKEIGSTWDLPEDADYYDPGDEIFKEFILDEKLKGYGFEAGDYDDFCICISKDCVEVIDPDVQVEVEDELTESLKQIEQTGILISDSLYEIKNKILNSKRALKLVGVTVNGEETWLIGNPYGDTHDDMLAYAEDSGYLSGKYEKKNNVYLNTVPYNKQINVFVDYSEGMEYDYDNTRIVDVTARHNYDNTNSFENTKLFKVLGEPKESKPYRYSDHMKTRWESLNEATSEQEDFFKNSVVRDRDGNLLPVYHCSFSEFNTFSIDQEDGALDTTDWRGEFGFAWFADNIDYARNYGDDSFEYECYLNIVNPLDIGELDAEVEDEYGTEVKDDYYDEGVISVSSDFIRLCKLVKTEPEVMIKWYHKWYESGCIYDITRRAFFKNLVVKLGYDGVVATESGERTWGCVRPNQIKLVSNENPTEKDSMKENKNDGFSKDWSYNEKTTEKDNMKESKQEVTFDKKSYEPIVIGGEEYSENDVACDAYYGILLDGEHIGNVAIDKNEIKGFEIYPKFRKQGLGKLAVKELLKNHSDINFVESIPEAKKFWHAVGFNEYQYDGDKGLYLMRLSESKQKADILGKALDDNCSDWFYNDESPMIDLSKPLVREDVNKPSDLFTFTLKDIEEKYPDLISNEYKSCGPAFIMPDGRFILTRNRFDTHEDFAVQCMLDIAKVRYDEFDIDEILEQFTKHFGLIRVNDGTEKDIEPRAYFVIKDRFVSSQQWESLRDFLEYLIKNRFANKTYDIQAFFGDAHHLWDLRNPSEIPNPEDMIEECRFAIRRGFFESLDASNEKSASIHEGYTYNELDGTGNYWVNGYTDKMPDGSKKQIRGKWFKVAKNELACKIFDAVTKAGFDCAIDGPRYSLYYRDKLKTKEKEIKLEGFDFYVDGPGIGDFHCRVVEPGYFQFREVFIKENAQKQGIAGKIIGILLGCLDSSWRVEVHANINNEFWSHIMKKYPQFTWMGVTSESLNKKPIEHSEKDGILLSEGSNMTAQEYRETLKSMTSMSEKELAEAEAFYKAESKRLEESLGSDSKDARRAKRLSSWAHRCLCNKYHPEAYTANMEEGHDGKSRIIEWVDCLEIQSSK